MNSRRFLKAGGFRKFPGEQDVKNARIVLKFRIA